MAKFPYDKPPELSDINYIIRSINAPPAGLTCPRLSTALIIKIPPKGPKVLSTSWVHLSSHLPLTGSSHKNYFFWPSYTPSWFPHSGLCSNHSAQRCFSSRPFPAIRNTVLGPSLTPNFREALHTFSVTIPGWFFSWLLLLYTITVLSVTSF